MLKLLRLIIESELWYWNWEITMSVRDIDRPWNNYTIFRHKYSGKKVAKRLR